MANMSGLAGAEVTRTGDSPDSYKTYPTCSFSLLCDVSHEDPELTLHCCDLMNDHKDQSETPVILFY